MKMPRPTSDVKYCFPDGSCVFPSYTGKGWLANWSHYNPVCNKWGERVYFISHTQAARFLMSQGQGPASYKPWDRMNANDYVESGGGFCVYCGTQHLSAGELSRRGKRLVRRIQCDACSHVFEELYDLTSVVEAT